MSKIFIYQLITITFLVAFFSCTENESRKPDNPLSVDLYSTTLNKTGGAITIVGQNNPAVDPAAIQSAVDQYQIVTLQGTFDFGTDGGVLITQPNVSLKGPAIINGGGAPFWVPWFSSSADLRNLFIIGINAPGVKVCDLTIDTQGNADGILVTSAGETEATGEVIKLKNNTIIAPGWGLGIVLLFRGGWPTVISGNTINANIGISDFWTGYTLNQNWEISKPVGQSGQLDIMNNNITVSGLINEGINLYGWPVTGAELQNVQGLVLPAPPDWGDNGPVKVTDNLIHLNAAQFYNQGIAIGHSASGLNNCTVRNNTITGNAYRGITQFPYARDNVINGNDLSGLVMMWESVLISGRNITCTNNIMGQSIPQPNPFNRLFTSSLILWSVNWHPPDTPMPLPTENCVIRNNDYRGTGLQGWDEGLGCILILSDIDWPLWSGVSTEVKNNFIKETGRFPRGTGGPSKQILEFIGENGLVYNNRIIGHPANKFSSGIGQKIKELRQQRMKNSKIAAKELSFRF
jgi:hypothetical protein